MGVNMIGTIVEISFDINSKPKQSFPRKPDFLKLLNYMKVYDIT